MSIENSRTQKVNAIAAPLLAASPIVLLVLLLILRVKALRAVLLALALLLVLGFWFPIGGEALLTMAQQVTGVSINIVFIMLGGMLIATQSTLSGAQTTMSNWFATAVGNPHRAVLLFGLGVTPLMESIIGWGVSLIVSIPLLMRTGLSATRAATIALLGLVLCPWGSLAPSMLLMAMLSGEPLTDIGIWAAVFTVPVLVVFGVAMVMVGVGRATTPRLLLELAITIGVMWAVLWATNVWIAPVLGGAMSGLAAVITLLAFGRISGARAPRFTETTTRAFAPYVILIGSMVLAVAITSFVDLGAWAEFWTSPGLWLMVTSAVAPLIFQLPRADSRIALRRGVTAWGPVCLTTMLYVLFGILLTVSGMAGTLATSAALLGSGFIAILPFIGALAGYVTASTSATAAMLTLPVTSSAVALGSNPSAILGLLLSTSGASASMAPSRIILAVSVAEEAREENDPKPDVVRITSVVFLANGVLLAVLVPLGWLLIT